MIAVNDKKLSHKTQSQFYYNAKRLVMYNYTNTTN